VGFVSADVISLEVTIRIRRGINELPRESRLRGSSPARNCDERNWNERPIHLRVGLHLGLCRSVLDRFVEKLFHVARRLFRQFGLLLAEFALLFAEFALFFS
jgi:hypothetical protein